MKVQLKVGTKTIIEADGEGVKQVFERLGELAEVFACTDRCGCCEGTDIVPSVRQPQGFTFYELHCLTCGARFQFGQTKEGGRLFPKRDKGANGWEKYQANGGSR